MDTEQVGKIESHVEIRSIDPDMLRADDVGRPTQAP